MLLTLNKYQKKASSTAVYKDKSYPEYLLVEEVGELFGKLSRVKRGDTVIINTKELALELGDILWAVSQIAKEYKLSLEKVAKLNLKKLRSRKKRNKLIGKGDHR